MKTVATLMPGTLQKILVKEGQEVKKGQDVAIMEAMKMEMSLKAESDGIIEYVIDKETPFVKAGEVIVKIC